MKYVFNLKLAGIIPSFMSTDTICQYNYICHDLKTLTLLLLIACSSLCLAGEIGSVPDGDANWHLAAELRNILNESPLTISTVTLPDGIEMVPYNVQLSATNGLSPYRWYITSGNLPTGLSLSASGAISGTPAGIESPSVTFMVMDAVDCTAEKGFLINVQTNPNTRPILVGAGASGQAAVSDVLIRCYALFDAYLGV